MKTLHEMYTPEEVQKLIAEIERHEPLGSNLQDAARHSTPEEREENPRLKAMWEALSRLDELQEEIRSTFRNRDGTLNVRV